MKQQTYIAHFIDFNGNKIDFERFSYSRLSSVIKAIHTLWNNSLYRVCTKGAEHVEIYRTPDGTTEEENPAAIVNLQIYND